MDECVLVLGDMLHDGLPGLADDLPIVMFEDLALCTRTRHHQQKLVLFLSAMRHFRDRLRAEGREVSYAELGSGPPMLEALEAMGPRRVHTYEINDSFFARELSTACFEVAYAPSPMFLTPWPAWDAYARSAKRLRMGDFYPRQRRRLGLLVDGEQRPIGGKWSLDEENRKPLGRSVAVPEPWFVEPDAVTREVIALVGERFPEHPGRATDFRLPTTHEDARAWLEEFVESRLASFGDYEDALTSRSRVVFHGLLTPFLNTGLLSPAEVIEAAMARHARSPVPLNSLEGFVRQVVGWREFIRGMDREYDRRDVRFKSLGDRRLGPQWWSATTGLPPLDAAIEKALSMGWCHHIERLMVLGSAMLMCDAAADEVHRWFMEMFIDSAEWVMRPNVMGMSQFADMGLFATKPYLSGSAYLLRMSDTPKGPWCEVWDGLFWRFVHRHRALFEANPRSKPMLLNLQRLDPVRRDRLMTLGEDFIDSVTLPGRV